MTEDELLDARGNLRFITIQSVLDPDEAELARAYADTLTEDQRSRWLGGLARLPIAEAVLRTRALLIVKRCAW
jgi:hypothetical protein